MEIKEKVARLQGLMEGMKFDTETNEGKLISGIIDVLGDISAELDTLYDDVDSLYEYADELDSDLGDVESEVYDLDYDDEDDDEYDECYGCENTVENISLKILAAEPYDICAVCG